MIFVSVAPASISSPMPFPIMARASGDTHNSSPSAGSASSSPTMRNDDRRPSSRQMFTVEPKATSEEPVGAAWICAVLRRAVQSRNSRAARMAASLSSCDRASA